MLWLDYIYLGDYMSFSFAGYLIGCIIGYLIGRNYFLDCENKRLRNDNNGPIWNYHDYPNKYKPISFYGEQKTVIFRKNDAIIEIVADVSRDNNGKLKLSKINDNCFQLGEQFNDIEIKVTGSYSIKFTKCFINCVTDKTLTITYDVYNYEYENDQDNILKTIEGFYS